MTEGTCASTHTNAIPIVYRTDYLKSCAIRCSEDKTCVAFDDEFSKSVTIPDLKYGGGVDRHVEGVGCWIYLEPPQNEDGSYTYPMYKIR